MRFCKEVGRTSWHEHWSDHSSTWMGARIRRRPPRPSSPSTCKFTKTTPRTRLNSKHATTYKPIKRLGIEIKYIKHSNDNPYRGQRSSQSSRFPETLLWPIFRISALPQPPRRRPLDCRVCRLRQEGAPFNTFHSTTKFIHPPKLDHQNHRQDKCVHIRSFCGDKSHDTFS